MTIKLLLNRYKEAIRKRHVNRVFIFIILLLISSCAGEYKNRKPSNTNTTIIHLYPASSFKDSKYIKDQEIKCRSIAPVGSHIKQTVCTTKEEWDKASQNGKDFAHKIIQRAGVN